MERNKTISTATGITRMAAAFACMALLGGCGGVELEGKVFDYAGLSGTTGKKPDPTMSSRAPLVMPPSRSSLPTPTESRSVAATRQDWPDDPEKVRVRQVEQQKAVQSEAERAAEPLNAYAGKETLLDKLFSKNKKTVTEAVPDVPEPDASDAIPGSNVASRQSITPHQSQEPLPDRNTGAFNPAAPSSYQSGSSAQRGIY